MINNNPNDQRSIYSVLLDNNNNKSSSMDGSNSTSPKKVANPILSSDFLCNSEETDQLIAAFNRAKQSAVKG